MKRYLEPSCRYHDIQLDVLRSTRPMKLAEGGSLREKDLYFRIYLEDLPQDQLVLFTDGYDACFLSGPTEIETKFRAMGQRVVFAAETNCWPWFPGLADRFPPSPTSYRYLNSGGIMGRAADLIDAIDRVQTVPDPEHAPWSNQARWISLFLDRPGDIGLDHECDIFYATAPPAGDKTRWPTRTRAFADPEYWRVEQQRVLARVSAEEARLRVRETGALPCHLHFNGRVYQLLQQHPDTFAEVMPWLP